MSYVEQGFSDYLSMQRATSEILQDINQNFYFQENILLVLGNSVFCRRDLINFWENLPFPWFDMQDFAAL